MVFTSDEMEEVRRISEQVAYEILGKMSAKEKQSENNEIVIQRQFDNNNPELMEIEINEWLKSTGAQEIHKIDVCKNPLSSMGVIKTVFVKVKAVPTTTLGAATDAANPPEGH